MGKIVCFDFLLALSEVNANLRGHHFVGMEAVSPILELMRLFSGNLIKAYSTKKRDKNGHLFGFVPHKYFCLFDPFTNMFTSSINIFLL